MSSHLPCAVVSLLIQEAGVLLQGLIAEPVAASGVGLAAITVRAPCVRILWVHLRERQVARGIHARHEDTTRLFLEGHLHRVAILLHLPLHVSSRSVRLLQQRDVGGVVDHLYAKAGKDLLVVAALILVDERARAMLLVVQIAAAVVALLLAHAVELALRHAIRRRVELLAEIDLVVNDVLVALNLLERLLGSKRSLLSTAHLLKRLRLSVKNDVAPELAVQHALVELLHKLRHLILAAHEKVARARDGQPREIASIADRHFWCVAKCCSQRRSARWLV